MPGSGKKPRTISTCSSTTGTSSDLRAMSAATATTPPSSCGASATRSASSTLPEGAAMAAAARATSRTRKTPRAPSTARLQLCVAAGTTTASRTSVDVFGFNYTHAFAATPMFRAAPIPRHARLRQRNASARQHPRRIFLPRQRRTSAPGARSELPGELLRPVRAPTWAIAPTSEFRALRTSIRTSPASSSGPASTTSASRRPTTPTPTNLLNFTDPRRKAARARSELDRDRQDPRSLAQLLLRHHRPRPASRRTASISTRRAGGPICRWRTSCRTGPGPSASGRSRRCTSTPPATRRSCSSTASRSAARRRGRSNIACAGTTCVYEPGELQVVAYKDGKQWARRRARTTGAAGRSSTLQADRAEIRADGQDLAFVTVRVADKDGVIAPRAKHRVRFTVEGPGEIVATDNGDPTSFESFQSKRAQRLQRPVSGDRAGEGGPGGSDHAHGAGGGSGGSRGRRSSGEVKSAGGGRISLRPRRLAGSAGG